MSAAPQPQPAPGPLAVAGCGFGPPAQPLDVPGTFRNQLTRDGIASESRTVEVVRDANTTRAAAVAIGMTPAGR
ncbi:hypothetical protein OG948_32900 [Embleya sp. NBC_00888]|uniref:hypothetical protein n=1 Tax=Embleya sp. NBC_00888 TaxID=2975960 RepID=UPI0038667A19|nr:hypothetical protein OG948_32900 [Embleya sp. NBC_00888]